MECEQRFYPHHPRQHYCGDRCREAERNARAGASISMRRVLAFTRAFGGPSLNSVRWFESEGDNAGDRSWHPCDHQPQAGARCRSLRVKPGVPRRAQQKRTFDCIHPHTASGPNGILQQRPIEGSATGPSAGQKIVLHTKNGKWWVQPLVDQPLTELRLQVDQRHTPRLSICRTAGKGVQQPVH
jgi:hypothetical protein